MIGFCFGLAACALLAAVIGSLASVSERKMLRRRM